MVRLSIGFSCSKPLSEYIALAKLIDQYGFDTLSIYNDLMFKPAWPILTMLAHHTQHVRLGPSVVNPYLEHPATLAGNVALLDEISNGRAYLGIGRGAFLEFLELDTPKPIATVREAIELIKRLLRGDRTPYHGQVFQATDAAFLQWSPPRAKIPIMVGTWGAKMCEMAGALADEVKAGAMWSAVYGRFMWERTTIGAQRIGRDPNEVNLAIGPVTSIAADRAEAKAYARRSLAFYLPYLAPMPEFVGVEPEEIERIKAALARGDYTEAADTVSETSLRHFALYGTPYDFIDRIEQMVEAVPVGRIEFGMPHGPDEAEAIRLLGEQVLPHFLHGS